MQYQQQAAPTEVLRPAPPPYPNQFDFGGVTPGEITTNYVPGTLSSPVSTTPSSILPTVDEESGYENGYPYAQRFEPTDCDSSAPLTPTTSLPTGHYVWQQGSPSSTYFVDGGGKFVAKDDANVSTSSDTAAILDLDTHRLLTAVATPNHFVVAGEQAGRSSGVEYAPTWHQPVSSGLSYGVQIATVTPVAMSVNQPQPPAWPNAGQLQQNQGQARDTSVQVRIHSNFRNYLTTTVYE
jgi:hypothetical protein